MSTTIVGLFRETEHAQNTYNQLRRANYEDTEGFVRGNYREPRLVRELKEAGVPRTDASHYLQTLQNNGIILMTHTSDYLSRQAEIIMERNHSLDIECDALQLVSPKGKGTPVEPGSVTTSLTYYGNTPPDDITLHTTFPPHINPDREIASPNSTPVFGGQTECADRDGTTPCDEEAHFLMTIYEQLLAWRHGANYGHARVYTRLIERSVQARSASRNKTLLIRQRTIQYEAAADELNRTHTHKFEIIEASREP